MIYVTSDLHGYPLEKFKELLDRAGFGDDDFLFILGDVIDRGEHSVDILKWLLVQPNVELILGNHEAMMLSCSFLFDEITEDSLDALDSRKISLLRNWKSNGAEATMEALARETPETRGDILEYLREAPIYDSVSVGGRDFLLVHGGLGGYSPERKLSDYSEGELVWTRPYLEDRYSDRFMTVLGHTPTCFFGPEYKGRMIKTDTWINIDTGAACSLSPMLLRLDDMQEFYVEE